jgi:cytochrome c-type biogenesis protein CcmH/NrfG
MGVSEQKRQRSSNVVILKPHFLMLAAISVVLCAGSARAQKSPSCHGCPALTAPTVTLPRVPDDRVVMVTRESVAAERVQKVCSLEPFPGLTNITSVEGLKLPAKAQKEYRTACSALKRNRPAESEEHLRKAVQIYPSYVVGWVMLGQIHEAQQHPDLARQACSRALDLDPKYLPSYLCLAEIAGREEKWREVLRYTSEALALDAADDAYAYFFSAIAYFNLNQLGEAEQRALKAAELDKEHHEPRVQFLLGQIYKAQNDPAKAAAELTEFLKYAPTAPDSDNVKEDVARLEGQTRAN